MKTYFEAEKLKYRHTCLMGIAAAMPLASVLLAALLTHAFFALDSYNWWYISLYPGFLGILCSIIGGKDRKKKNHTIGSLPCEMTKIWDAKILVGAVMNALSVLCVVLYTIVMGKGMETVLQMQFIAAPSVGMQLLAGVVMWLTSLWQIPFCLFLSQRMGTFMMLVIHMGLSTVLAVTVSLKPWFALLPWAITARLMCPVLGVLPNGLLLQPGQQSYSASLAGMENLLIGIPAALLWFGLFWMGSRRWFERQVTGQ